MTRWVVVGGGAAGAVIAGRLSDDPSNEVVLAEAGPDHPPAGDDTGPYLADPARLTEHSVRRTPARSPERYAVGHGLGGSSLVNGSVVVAGGPGADGVGHDLPLEEPARVGPLGAALRRADQRARDVLLARQAGRRVTPADVVLRPRMPRPNLVVHTETPVVRLILDRRRAVGVTTAPGDELMADRVVVCAGALATPILLLASGVDVDGLGEHLHDHPAIAITVTIDEQRRERESPDIGVVIDAGSHQIIALERTAPGSPHGALMVGLTKVTSRGSVGLADDGRPSIDLNQLATDTDRARMRAAVRDALDLLDDRAVRATVTAAWADDDGTPIESIGRDDESIDAWIIRRLTGFHHAAGTCRRGLVTDDDGWLRGYEGLAVGDASLFAEAPPTNIHLATVIEAGRLADRWLAATQ